MTPIRSAHPSPPGDGAGAVNPPSPPESAPRPARTSTARWCPTAKILPPIVTWLKAALGFSRSHAERLINQGAVWLNDRRVLHRRTYVGLDTFQVVSFRGGC